MDKPSHAPSFWLAVPPRLRLYLSYAADAVLLGLSVACCLLLLNAHLLPWSPRGLLFCALLPVFTVPVLREAGLYFAGLRFLDSRLLWSLVGSVFFGSLLWTATAYLSGTLGGERIPYGAPLFVFLLSAAALLGLRMLGRMLIQRSTRKAPNQRPCLILGMSDDSRELLRLIELDPAIAPIGFIDLENQRRQNRLDGLPVYGLEDLDRVADNKPGLHVFSLEEAFRSSSRHDLEVIASLVPNAIRVLPHLPRAGLYTNLLQQSRTFSIVDLLGRSEHLTDIRHRRDLATRAIMVTGAAGTIGSELCRQAALAGVRKLVAVDFSEAGLYQLSRQDFWAKCDCEVHFELANIIERPRLTQLLSKNEIDEVFHAAAYKHVGLLENNIEQAIKNNILGTQALLQACEETKIANFVLVSSDKAVEPKSIMGLTKRWCEQLVQRVALEQRESGSNYCTVRFGNVLGSSGSVIPLFQEQIKRGGPLTVTHPEVSRYFMSVNEAVSLIILSLDIDAKGQTFVLDMGEPIKILDLAKKMAELAGHKASASPDSPGDIPVIFTGLGLGEKLHEALLNDHEMLLPTRVSKIRVAEAKSNDFANIKERTELLAKALIKEDRSTLLRLLANDLEIGAELH